MKINKLQKYNIFSDGRVEDTTTGGNPSSYKDKDGYIILKLKLDGKWYHKRHHRVIAEAFIPNPENKPQVNHINGIKTDNRVENLEWVTSRENNQHAWDKGFRKATEIKWAHIEYGEVLCSVRELTKLFKEQKLNEGSLLRVSVGYQSNHKGWTKKTIT